MRCRCGHIEDDHVDGICWMCDYDALPNRAHEFDEDVEGYEEPSHGGGEGLDEQHMREAGRTR